MRLSKATMERRHAMQRARERYGIVYNARVREQILGAIQHGRSRVVARQSNRVSIHDVEHEDRIVRVVYDRKRGEIVTFLPIEIANSSCRTGQGWESPSPPASIPTVRGDIPASRPVLQAPEAAS